MFIILIHVSISHSLLFFLTTNYKISLHKSITCSGGGVLLWFFVWGEVCLCWSYSLNPMLVNTFTHHNLYLELILRIIYINFILPRITVWLISLYCVHIPEHVLISWIFHNVLTAFDMLSFVTHSVSTWFLVSFWRVLF